MNPKLETCISTLHSSVTLCNRAPVSVKGLPLVPLSLLLLTSSFITFPEQPGQVVSSTMLVKLRETTLWTLKQRPSRTPQKEEIITARILAHHSGGSTL